ncbi:MAG TPA: Spy/CpxP family protein refolding chaperone [Thermoanaerobaculia bacterium]|nr:Spy/CpxP family protein refolding chaperone [Thermoanaerobaculia bacterium]
MNARKLMLFAAAFAALLALPFAAEAAPRGGQNAEQILKNPRALARYLRLTPEQVATFKTLREDLEADVKPLREARKPLRQAFYAELEAASPNACETGEAALALHENGDKIRAEFEEFDTAFSAILTPEQLAKYEALKEAAGLGRDEEED